MTSDPDDSPRGDAFAPGDADSAITSEAGPGARQESLAVELRALVVVAAPVALVQLGAKLLGLVDTAVVGRLGQSALAGVGLADGVYFLTMLFGLGVMLGLDPLMAQAIGADRPRDARRWFRQGVWIALLLGPLLIGLAALIGANLELFGVEPGVCGEARRYLHARMFAIIPTLLFAGARSALLARSRTRPMVLAVIFANVLNVPASVGLTFGDRALVELGLPAIGFAGLGVVGAGLASVIAELVQWLCLLFALGRLNREDGPELADDLTWTPRPTQLLKAARVGMPQAFAMICEVGAFVTTAFLMARISELAMASHQVAIQLASTTFMIPVGISQACAMRVGHAIGRGDARGTRRAGQAALLAGLAFMSASSLLFLTIPEPLARILTDEGEIVRATLPLLFVAALFQLSDGAQIIATGLLRGAGDTRWPFLANLGGHYLIGLPIGALLTFRLGYGPVGLWWGLSLGLTIAALTLALRFLILSLRPIARLDPDGDEREVGQSDVGSAAAKTPTRDRPAPARENQIKPAPAQHPG